MSRIAIILLLVLLLGAAVVGLYLSRDIHSETSPPSGHITTPNASHNRYKISSLTLRPLSYEQSFSHLDSASVLIGLLSGEYDTTIRESRTYEVHTGTPGLPTIDSSSPVRYIRSMRDYLYRLIPIACDTGDRPHSLETDDADTIIQRLARLEYQGNCTEHAIIGQRLLRHVTTTVYHLKRDSNELVNHVIDLVYYRQNGKIYAVTLDALMGIIGPVKADGSFYTVSELDHVDPILDYPADLKTKRYPIDTAHIFSNLNNKIATAYYTYNGYIYYLGYDDMYILAPQEMLYDKMPRKEFDKKYAVMLAGILRRQVPSAVREYL